MTYFSANSGRVFATLSKKLFDRLKGKAYREAYVEEHVRTGIAYQIRALRAQRDWPQKKLAEEMRKPQSVVSRLEDPEYGKLSVQTLLEVAATFDVALIVQFVGFPEFLRRTRDVSPEAMRADSFDPTQLRPVALQAAAISSEPERHAANIVVGRFASWQIASSPPAEQSINLEAAVH